MKNKKWVKILIIVVIVVVVLGFLKNFLIKTAVTIGAQQVVGAPVKIAKLSFGILNSSVKIKGFKLYNPKGFPHEPMMDITEMRVDYDLPALLKGKLHLPVVVLRLNEMVLVKNKEGQLNVDALKVAQEGEKEKKPEDKAEKPSQQLAMQIDELRLDLGKVIYKDFTKSDTPTIDVYDIGVHDKTFKNIESAQQLAALVMMEAMGPTAIKSAKMYAAATILGVGFLPVGVAGLLLGDDNGMQEFNADFNKTYDVMVDVVKKMGEIVSEDPSLGLIKAKVNGADITIRLSKIASKKTQVTIAARKFMVPKPEIAQGVLYKAAETLK